jgi:hypothetical protein
VSNGLNKSNFTFRVDEEVQRALTRGILFECRRTAMNEVYDDYIYCGTNAACPLFPSPINPITFHSTRINRTW